MSVSITRDGLVTSHNAYDADFDEMVAATEKIIAELQKRLSDRKYCPYSHGGERKHAAVSALTASPPVVEREAVRSRVCKLTMPKGEVIEVEYPTSSAWAKSWSVRYPPDMEVGTTGEQDWELVERYGLTAILDAAILALTPVEGVGWQAEAEHQEELATVYRRAQLTAEEKLCREEANAKGWQKRAERLEQKLAALSTPVAQGDEVRDAIRAAHAIFEQASDFYTARNGRRMSIEGDDGEKCWIVPFDAFEELRHALATLTKGARDAG